MAKITIHGNRTTSLNLQEGQLIDLGNLLRYVDVSTLRADLDDPAEFEQMMAVARDINAAIDAKFSH